MPFIRIFIFSFLFALSGLLVGQKPTNKATASKLTQAKPAIDTVGMAAEMGAYQIFSNKVNALAKQKSDNTVEKLVRLANELAADYPCGRFPSVLMDAKGKPLTLKAQKEVHYSLFPEMSKIEVGKENGLPESSNINERQFRCLVEYYNFTHYSTPIGQAVPEIVILTEIPYHQTIYKSSTGITSECSVGDIYLYLPRHILAPSY